MAIISGTIVTWSADPRIITIPAPIVEASIEDLQDTLQDLEDSETGIVFPKLRTTAGGEALGGGVTVGWTMTLNNAQIQFEGRTATEETGTCTTSDTTGTELIATGGQFVINSISRGDIVFNVTTGAMATILTIESDTQLTHQLLSGGTRATWLSTDSYAIYLNVRCTISGGNLVAVDYSGTPISSILASANTDTIVALSSSATTSVVETGVSGLTASESAMLSAINTLTDELHKFKGLNASNPASISGDGVTESVVTVDGNVLTITPTSITRT